MTVVGYVPGAYDLFHVGHLNILRRARPDCDVLIAGVVTDETVLRAKGKPPVVPLVERLQIVASIGFVDQAVVDTSTDKRVMWERLHFDVLFKGDDWKGTEKGALLESSMASVGVRVVYFPYTAHTSSTSLRALLARQLT
ncbi:adenylyltransferase/cytidyltransferase family protein [Fodinicola acaciae]|uniref:adenylyltransferase/cytidyltransferase family protein n=1 Tax=Fodinicola acaciae TaxID=2681555 RepID=UPI0013D3BC86|nr:adenylyltransferase/cytidyltransferase family protein [Fodinicola acaciae]